MDGIDGFRHFQDRVLAHLEIFSEGTISLFTDYLRRWTDGRGSAHAEALRRFGDYLCRLRVGHVSSFHEFGIKAYEVAFSLTPEDWRVAERLGAAFLERQLGERKANLKAAIDYLKIACRGVPQRNFSARGNLYALLGLAYASFADSDRNKEPGSLSESFFEKALQTLNEDSSGEQRAAALVNMGNRFGKKQPERSMACYRQALKIYSQLENWSDVALVERNLAAALLDAGGDKDIAEAIRLLSQAFSRISSAEQPYDFAIGLLNLGTAYAKQTATDKLANFRKALDCFQQSAKVFAKLGNRSLARLAWRSAGGIWYEIGLLPESGGGSACWKESLRCFREAIALLDEQWFQQMAVQTRLSLVRENAVIFDFAVLAAEKARDEKAAFELLDHGRTRVLVEMFSGDAAHRPQGVSKRNWGKLREQAERRRIYEGELTNLRSQNPDGDSRELERKIEACRNEQRKFVNRVRPRITDLVHGTHPFPVHEAGDLARRLGGTICVLRPTRKGTILFGFLPDGKPRHEILESVTVDRLHEVVLNKGGWFDAYEAFLEAAPQDKNRFFYRWAKAMDQSLVWLCKDIVEPSMSILGLSSKGDHQSSDNEKPRIYFMPGGVLDLLPLHAAFQERNGVREYLIDRVDVGYFPSFRLLRHSIERASRTLPDNLTVYRNTNEPLPFGQWEMASVAQAFLRLEILDNQTSLSLKAESVALFSCHAKSNTTDALKSGFYLYRKHGEEPDFTFPQLLTLRTPSPRLAILSACETSLAEKSDPADECLSLANGFLARGVGGVVGTQWLGNDLACALWTGKFFEQYRKRPWDPLRCACFASRWVRDSNRQEKENSLERYKGYLPENYALYLLDSFSLPCDWASHRFSGASLPS
jgi:tetratricopeptide (TPR) repeat protein